MAKVDDGGGDNSCYLLLSEYRGDPPSEAELKKALEDGDTIDRINTMKIVIQLMLAGEKFPALLISIIRYVQTQKDHTLKKLVQMYFEIVDKRTPDGNPIDIFVLACNAWLQDLNHPNEYVRGSTLRFLCKIKEPSLLEPLVPSIRTCLEHRHSYVRRNAVLAIYSIYTDFENLIPDAPDVILEFLENERDVSCKRNAFIMLYNCAQPYAVSYLHSNFESVVSFGPALQLAIVQLIRSVYRNNPSSRSMFIKCVVSMLDSESPAVRYEAASTLLSLSSAAAAVKAAAGAFIDLAANESDNSVKLIVLDRLAAINERHGRILSELLMDVLRILSSPNMDIKKKTLDLALALVSPATIDEVVLVLKKEINRTQDSEAGDAAASASYRQMLIRAIHSCAIKFPDIAGSVVHNLMDFVSDSNASTANDVVVFVREVVEKFEPLRAPILAKLVDVLPQVQAASVARGVLWILGEYSEGGEEIAAAFACIKSALGTIPFVLRGDAAEEKDDEADSVTSGATSNSKKPATAASKLNADGTYASQSAVSMTKGAVDDIVAEKTAFPLRALVFAGDFFLATAIATTLTKLILKTGQIIRDSKRRNAVVAEIMLILTSFLRLGRSGQTGIRIDDDSFQRIMLCIEVLSAPTPFATQVFLESTRQSFALLLHDSERRKAAAKAEEKQIVETEADDCIVVKQLRGTAGGDADFEDDIGESIGKATGRAERSNDATIDLKRVFQLTGFSDPIYAEAYVNVHKYDITMNVYVVNTSPDTLQNLSLELATLGDLKLVERPTAHTLGPGESKTIKANIKVSSTDTGIIFGNIVYDIAGAAGDSHCVVLNDVHIDIIDYIRPADCTDTEFRKMWAEFEWENKVAINAAFSDVTEFLHHIVATTNMRCLTPDWALEGACGFLAANLYAQSIFGEDALANLSIEQVAENKVAGYVRIRSKTQGIALSLGDKITLDQGKPSA